MTVIATIPARTRSTRLPNKVMLPISNQPLLWHVWQQVSKSHSVDSIYICTTAESADDEIVDFAKEFGIKYVRGDSINIIERLILAANAARADIIVSIDGEQPLTDPYLIDKAVEIIRHGYPFIAFRGIGLGKTPIAMTVDHLKHVYSTKDTKTDQDWWKLLSEDYDWCVDSQKDYDYIKEYMENERMG